MSRRRYRRTSRAPIRSSLRTGLGTLAPTLEPGRPVSCTSGCQCGHRCRASAPKFRRGLPMYRGFLLLLVLAVAIPARAVSQSDTTAPAGVQSDTAVPGPVLDALRATIADRYVTRVPADSLARFKTAEGLLASLGDRHTVLFSPRAF